MVRRSSQIPTITDEAVAAALKSLRQNRIMRGNPLIHLAWIRDYAERHHAVIGPAGQASVLRHALADAITGQLARHRRLNDLPPEIPDSRAGLLDALRRDAARSNMELSAWSALYYRYICIELNLQVGEIATHTGVAPKQVRRWMNLGYERLAELIADEEASARGRYHEQLRLLRLPPLAYDQLRGAIPLLDSLYRALCTPVPPNTHILTGMAGAGKSSTAHALATRLLADGCFDDAAWISLNAPANSHDVYAAAAAELDYPFLAEAAFDTLEAGLRARFADRPTLLVLDNADWLDRPAETLAALERLILPGHLLAVQRSLPPVSAPGVVYRVEPLAPDVFAQHLVDTARKKRVDVDLLRDERVMNTLQHVLGGNPLAGLVAVWQLRALPLERVLATLPTLTEPQHDDGLFDRLFHTTWSRLSPDAHRAAYALIVAAADSVEWAEVQALSGLTPRALDRALTQLVESALVEAEPGMGIYTLHPLARLFIEMQFSSSKGRAAHDQLMARMTARIETPVTANEQPEQVTRTLLMLRRELESAPKHEVPLDLVLLIAPAARRSGQWTAWRDVLLRMRGRLPAYAGEGDHAKHARVLLELGIAQRWLGEWPEAEATLQGALRLLAEAGDAPGQAEALLEIGTTHQAAGHTAAAYESYEQAFATARQIGHEALQRRAANRLASLALDNNRPAEALALLEPLAQGGPLDAETLSNLGMAYLYQGNAESAVSAQRRALERYEASGSLPEQARIHLRLGMAYHESGDGDRAISHLQAALSLMRQVGDALGEARALNNLGTAYAVQQRTGDALSIWRDALHLQETLGDVIGMAYTWFNLGDLYWQLGQHQQAQAAMSESRGLADHMALTTLQRLLEGHPATA